MCLVTAALAVVLAASPEIAQNQDQDSRGLPKTSAAAPPPELRVDINHASLEQLLKVPGMTRSWAGRIVRFRPYRSKLDLLEDGVLPNEVYIRFMDNIIAHRDKQ
jgi:DNA uptake protein ComE-like DNA-binding protein